MADNIKSMKFYCNVDRIYSELKELGYSRDSSLPVEDVSRFDQYHYHGVLAADQAIERMNITASSRVLDIGAGLGGVARHLAAKTRCDVTTVELQPDLDAISADLTKRCGLADRITNVCGDFLQMNLEDLGKYDVIVSILVFLHIPNKKELFDACRNSLKDGGHMCIEDYFEKGVLTEREKQRLKIENYCERLCSKDEYIKLLNGSGFDCEFKDSTVSWGQFVRERLEAHIEDRDRYIRVHGHQVFNEQEHFYDFINDLYGDGNLGGCKISAARCTASADSI